MQQNKFYSIVGLVLNSAVSFIGVLAFGWQPQDLAAYFVGATVLMIIFQTGLLTRAGAPEKMVAVSLIYGLGLLTVLTIFFFDRLYPTASDYTPVDSSISGWVYINILSLLAFQLYDYKRKAVPQNHRVIMYPVLGKLLVLFFTLILGSIGAGLTGSAAGYLLTMVLLDCIISAYLYFKST